jgi:hypothetical protein
MISRDNLPKPALDWGVNDSLAGILNTILNLLSGILEPLSALIDAILGLFGIGGDEA